MERERESKWERSRGRVCEILGWVKFLLIKQIN